WRLYIPDRSTRFGTRYWRSRWPGPGRWKSRLIVARFRDSYAIAGKRRQDLVRRLDPDVGAGVFVPGVDPFLDVAFELRHRAMRSALDLLGRQLGEPALDEIEPARARGDA